MSNLPDDVAQILEEELGFYVVELGYQLASTAASSVTYRRDESVINLAVIDDYQLLEPHLEFTVGFVEPDGTEYAVGFWRAIREDEQARQYLLSSFDDEESLRAVLKLIGTEVLKPHLGRVVNSEALIWELLMQQQNDAESQYRDDRRKNDLLRARNAFDAGQFQEAIDAYGLVGFDTLLASDNRRLHVARTRVDDTPDVT